MKLGLCLCFCIIEITYIYIFKFLVFPGVKGLALDMFEGFWEPVAKQLRLKEGRDFIL